MHSNTVCRPTTAGRNHQAYFCELAGPQLREKSLLYSTAIYAGACNPLPCSIATHSDVPSTVGASDAIAPVSTVTVEAFGVAVV